VTGTRAVARVSASAVAVPVGGCRVIVLSAISSPPVVEEKLWHETVSHTKLPRERVQVEARPIASKGARGPGPPPESGAISGLPPVAQSR